MGYGCDSWTLNCAATAWTYLLGGRGFDLDGDDTNNTESASTINEASIVVAARLKGLIVYRCWFLPTAYHMFDKCLVPLRHRHSGRGCLDCCQLSGNHRRTQQYNSLTSRFEANAFVRGRTAFLANTTNSGNVTRHNRYPSTTSKCVYRALALPSTSAFSSGAVTLRCQ